MIEERIQKLVSNYSSYSRREFEGMINDKRVHINGTLAILGQKITLDDNVTVDGKKLKFITKHNYYLLNKPKGFICSRYDDLGKTAISLIDNPDNRNLSTIGRLDVNTTGLIIVSDDGDLAQRITKPGNNVEKVYLVWTKWELSKQDLIDLENGIVLDNGYKTKKIPNIKKITTGSVPFYKIKLKEGKNNQIRKMMVAVDNEVINLKRESIGGLSLDSIPIYKYRKVSKSYIYDKLNLINQ